MLGPSFGPTRTAVPIKSEDTGKDYTLTIFDLYEAIGCDCAHFYWRCSLGKSTCKHIDRWVEDNGPVEWRPTT